MDIDFSNTMLDELPIWAQDALVIGLLIILLWVLQWFLTALIFRVVKRVTRLARDNWEDDILEIIRQPMRYISTSIALFIAVELINVDESIATFTTSLARSLIIIAIFVGIFKAADIFLVSNRRFNRYTGLSLDDQLMPFLRTAIKIIIVAVAIVIVVQEWGFNASGLVAGFGLGGLAFSLAAQDTVSNLFGFSTIVGDRPFNIGEFIIAGDVEGTVEKVGVRSTRIRRLDQALIIVPNSELANSAITNWSRLRKRWIEMTIGLTYDATEEDLQTVISRIEEMLTAREKVFEDSIQVTFSGFGGSSLDILIRCYVDERDWYPWMKEKEAISFEIMSIVREAGQSMAFPSRSLYVESVPEDLRPHDSGDTEYKE